MDFTQVLIQISILFILMFLGYYLRRHNWISETGVKDISTLIFYVTMPALILASVSETDLQGTGSLLDVLIASTISYTFFIAVGLLMPRLLRVEEGSRGLYKFMTIFANVGFIGFPMLIAILDESAVFLGAVLNIPFNFLLFTLGVYFIVSDKDSDHRMQLTLRHFLNPGIVATVVGLCTMLFSITIPPVIMGVADTLGAVTTPLAMIVVGASLVGVNIKQMISNYRVLILSAIRMLLFPLFIGLVLRALGLERSVIAVAMVLAGMPIGTNTVIIARQYGGNVLDASEAVFLSTTLLILTAPFLVLMLQILT